MSRRQDYWIWRSLADDGTDSKLIRGDGAAPDVAVYRDEDERWQPVPRYSEDETANEALRERLGIVVEPTSTGHQARFTSDLGRPPVVADDPLEAVVDLVYLHFRAGARP